MVCENNTYCCSDGNCCSLQRESGVRSLSMHAIQSTKGMFALASALWQSYNDAQSCDITGYCGTNYMSKNNWFALLNHLCICSMNAIWPGALLNHLCICSMNAIWPGAISVQGSNPNTGMLWLTLHQKITLLHLHHKWLKSPPPQHTHTHTHTHTNMVLLAPTY